MPLGKFLIERNVIDPAQLEAALEHQKRAGDSLIESLIAVQAVAREELEALLGEAPPAPETLEETGLEPRFLLALVLKTLFVTGVETTPAVARHTALPETVADGLLQAAKEQRLVEVLGLADSRRSIYRYALTDAGRARSLEALEQSHYVGPAPVPLDVYRAQSARQTISRDRITPESMQRALSHLVLPPGVSELLGPAANSGKSILLYGSPGNGKTSIAEALGQAFEGSIYIPHCVEVGGQIIRIFDDALHVRCDAPQPEEGAADGPPADRRWVRCRRPVVVTGGELTMEMLDLSFDAVSKFYEAPIHVKANGGVFIIDDFGRQRVRSVDLVNRWILPLERRVDFLTLHTGKKLEVPFDQLVVFSTNFPPRDLIDDAGLRRIPYKFAIPEPTPEDYAAILRGVCEANRLELDAGVLPYLLERFYPATGLARSGAHPRALVEQVLDRCRFHGGAPHMSLELLHAAVRNLLVDGEPPPLPGRAGAAAS